jgi:hypothetical protein
VSPSECSHRHKSTLWPIQPCSIDPNFAMQITDSHFIQFTPSNKLNLQQRSLVRRLVWRKKKTKFRPPLAGPLPWRHRISSPEPVPIAESVEDHAPSQLDVALADGHAAFDSYLNGLRTDPFDCFPISMAEFSSVGKTFDLCKPARSQIQCALLWPFNNGL